MKIREDKEEIINSTITILCEKSWNKIQKKIAEGMDSISAYDEVLKSYTLEEEIILTYEIEVEKAGFTKNLDLKPEEIKEMKDKIKRDLLNRTIKKP